MQKEDIIKNKNEAIKMLNNYLDTCVSKDGKYLKKANLISYWLKDYVRYIEKEETFNSSKLKKYSRGDIIKVNLGFNVGNEEGGLHYCVVLDMINARKYSTLTVIPLTSQKENKSIPKSAILIGTEIYDKLSLKNKALKEKAKEKSKKLRKELQETLKLPENNEDEKLLKNVKQNNINDKIKLLNNDIDLINKIQEEISQMKNGSVALVNQITTISKQRIYNPKLDIDVLSGIKLSNDSLNLIDKKLKELFTKN
ncbi:MAG: type II toxin-antitoxin system PemK/MazF family toxin [Clostridia bacterium]|nr:type II toxin-antitoxin system PemK/MazF family toxin [Clostridia bacterium]